MSPVSFHEPGNWVAEQKKHNAMRILTTLIIGFFFFATCMLLLQPLYLFWALPLLLPFAVGYVLSYILGWSGWFAYLEHSVTIMQGGLAILASIALPILIGVGVTFIEARRLNLPDGITDIRRSIGPDRFHITFLEPEGIVRLKKHFQDHHGISYWHDMPSPETTDDPETLAQIVTPNQSQSLWILLSNKGLQTFVEIGGPNGRPEPAVYVAAAGLLFILAMIALGPPHRPTR